MSDPVIVETRDALAKFCINAPDILRLISRLGSATLWQLAFLEDRKSNPDFP